MKKKFTQKERERRRKRRRRRKGRKEREGGKKCGREEGKEERESAHHVQLWLALDEGKLFQTRGMESEEVNGFDLCKP